MFSKNNENLDTNCIIAYIMYYNVIGTLMVNLKSPLWKSGVI